jgi:peptide deformylase
MNLKLWPDNSLKKKCKNVDEFNDYLHNLLDEMHSVLEENQALGLAANQLGFDLRVFLLRDKHGIVNEIINPTVIATNGKQYENEACLSFPGITVKIERPQYVHFSYYNRKGNVHEAVAMDIEAICFCHEMEHLEGKTILNNLNRKQRKAIEAEMNK